MVPERAGGRQPDGADADDDHVCANGERLCFGMVEASGIGSVRMGRSQSNGSERAHGVALSDVGVRRCYVGGDDAGSRLCGDHRGIHMR